MRIPSTWHRDSKWANAVGKILEIVLPQTFSLFTKMQYLQSVIKQSTIKWGVPVLRMWAFHCVWITPQSIWQWKGSHRRDLAVWFLLFTNTHGYWYQCWCLYVDTWTYCSAFLVAQTVKNLPAVKRYGFDCWVRKCPWRREWQPTPVFLPGEFHGQRSLVGYSPWGRKELDTSD